MPKNSPPAVSPFDVTPQGDVLRTRAKRLGTQSSRVVLALVCTLSMITYLDRVCFGMAAPSLAKDLNLNSVAELKWAFTGFAIAYAIFEVPTGWLGDRLGPRSMLIRIVVWWSACTTLTGLVGIQVGGWTLGGLGTLIVLRFLFGAGEAGAYPNITRVLYNWFPAHRWEFAQGLVWMSGRLAGGATPLIWAVLVGGTGGSSPLLSWRGAFVLFGLIGLVWCVLFAALFRNHPDKANSAKETESPEVPLSPGTEIIGHASVPWRALFTNRSVLALCAMYSLINYGWAFNITYLPSYLDQRFGIADSDLLGAVYKGAPLWVGAVGCLTGGLIVGFFSRKLGSRSNGRRAVGILAMLVCMFCWLGACVAPNIHVFCFCVSLAAFCIDCTLGAIWATCQDLGREHTAVTAACMNTIGTMGAALAGWATGTIIQQTVARRAAEQSVPLSKTLEQAALLDGYQFVFLTYAAVYAIAAAIWLFIDSNRRLTED